jgi:predicted NBD/HSP70 family sugar kinase
MGRHVPAAAVAAAALFDADRTVVVHAPILDRRDRPLRADLTGRLRLPVVVDNDANAAAWGEYRHGAGIGERCLVMVTLGTGVAGGVVIDDRLLSGGFGLAAELGHLKVGAEGRSCPCGAQDCLEQYASGTALRRAARTAAARDPGAASRLLALAGSDLERIDGPLITEAARKGDPLARRVVGEIGTWLGRGLAQMAAVLDPSPSSSAGASRSRMSSSSSRRGAPRSLGWLPRRPAACADASGGARQHGRGHRRGCTRPDSHERRGASRKRIPITQLALAHACWTYVHSQE